MMQGFFSLEEVASKSRPQGKHLSCTSCGRIDACETPKFVPQGANGKRIMNVFDMPSRAQDEQGKMSAGNGFRYMNSLYKKHGLSMMHDCINLFSIRCYSSSKKKSNEEKQRMTCLSQLEEAIHTYKPELIFLYGAGPVTSLIKCRREMKIGPIDKWVGYVIPDQHYETWLAPMYDPKDVIIADSQQWDTVFEQHFVHALSHLSKVVPVASKLSDVTVIDEETEIVRMLKRIKQGKPSYLALDYETTGLKPHRTSEHSIVCASFAFNITEHVESWCFPLPRSPKGKFILKEILAEPAIGKIAHNMNFEAMWTRNILGYDIQGWAWDTMQAAHILNNTPGVSGLKFQTYVNFGVAGYEKDVETYLRAQDEKDSNSTNTIQLLMNNKEGRRTVMQYCGYDSLYTYNLAIKQTKQMEVFLP